MSKPIIHPTAYIDPSAVLGEDVAVGPFAVIEGNVKIGARSQILAHAVVHRNVTMGQGNTVHPHAVLGGVPQDLAFVDTPEVQTHLEIGDNNVFREGCTVNRGTTKEDGFTRIGSNCYFMNNTHIAHDCTIKDSVVFATGVTLGGHVRVDERAFVGGGVMVHQFCRLGRFVMVQGTSGINKDVIPFMLVGGRPVWHYRLNTIGLRRAGISGEKYKILSDAFRLLKQRQSIEHLSGCDEIEYLKNWLAAESKRGIHGFIATRDKGDTEEME